MYTVEVINWSPLGLTATGCIYHLKHSLCRCGTLHHVILPLFHSRYIIHYSGETGATGATGIRGPAGTRGGTGDSLFTSLLRSTCTHTHTCNHACSRYAHTHTCPHTHAYCILIHKLAACMHTHMLSHTCTCTHACMHIC